MKYFILSLILLFAGCSEPIKTEVIECKVVELKTSKHAAIYVDVNGTKQYVSVNRKHCKFREDILGKETFVYKSTYKNGNVSYSAFFPYSEYCE